MSENTARLGALQDKVPGTGFQIVVEHIGLRSHNLFQGRRGASNEVWCEDFNSCVG
jgi:hypothetical protein